MFNERKNIILLFFTLFDVDNMYLHFFVNVLP